MNTPVKMASVKMTKKVGSAVKVTSILGKSRAALRKKYDALGGEATFGKIPDGSLMKRIWDFGDQCLVYNTKRDEAFHILGDICKKWREVGPDWIPNTDELPTPDGVGRYNHFSEDTASIYWTPQTGACAIYGDIRKRWSDTGWEGGYLGYPTSDEGDIDEGGRANCFQNGWIYWWPDIGAIDLKGVVVTYVGFYAYSESDHDQSSGSDEPYCIFTVVAPKSDVHTLKTQVYRGVDDQSARPDRMELYRGPAYGLSLGIVGMENDKGSPEANRLMIQNAVMTNHEVGKFLLQFIPLVGPIISKAAGPLLDGLMPKLGNAIASFLDLGDDLVGSVTKVLGTRDLVTMAIDQKTNNLKGIVYKFESPMMEHGGARYKAHFTVDPV